MSKGGKSQTTTNQTTIPDYIQNPQQAMIGAAGQMVEPFLQVPNVAVAGLNADHDASFDMIRQASMNQFSPGSDYSGRMADVSYNPDIAGYGNAATVTGEQIQNKMNPYTDMVLDGMRDEYGQAQSAMASRYAAGNAFGGSREAVSNASLADRYAQDRGRTLANAYQNAQGAAQAEAGRQMQAVTGSNSAQLGKANVDLEALRAAAAAQGDTFNRQLQAGTSVAGIGDVVRGVEQQGIDVPWQMLQRFQGVVPGVYPTSSTTTQPLHSNPASSVLGAGLMFGGMLK